MIGDMLEWFFGDANQWGALFARLATVGGLVALSIAALTYWRNVTAKREEQARLVYARVVEVRELEPAQSFGPLDGVVNGVVANAVRMVGDAQPGEWTILVYVSDEPVTQAVVKIHNGSKELMGPAHVQVVHGVTGELLSRLWATVDVVDPESEARVSITWVSTFYPGSPPLAATVTFRDASGQWWRRHRAEPIVRTDEPEPPKKG